LDYGLAGIVVDGNLVSGGPDVELKGLTIAGNRLSDHMLGVGVFGSDVDMSNGSIEGNTIQNSLVGSALYGSYGDFSNWKINNNSIDQVLCGIFAGGYDANMDSFEVSGNMINDSTIGLIFGFGPNTTARNAEVKSNMISGSVEPNQAKLVEIMVGEIGTEDDLEELLGMKELGLQYPNDLPATGGYAGLVGLIDSASDVSLEVSNNQVENNLVGLYIHSEGNAPDAEIDIRNNVSSGPNVLTGSEFNETHSGNTPPLLVNPVIP